MFELLRHRARMLLAHRMLLPVNEPARIVLEVEETLEVTQRRAGGLGRAQIAQFLELAARVRMTSAYKRGPSDGQSKQETASDEAP